MTLFGFGKKKEKEINAPVCTCNGNCSVSETVEPENLNNCCQDIQGRICCIKVLGSGCCHALYENTQSAVKAMGISVEVEYITDLKKVMEYGVMSVPALVVNNKVVSTGKVLKTENVQKLLQKIVSEKSSLIHSILHKTGTITSGFEGKKRKYHFLKNRAILWYALSRAVHKNRTSQVRFSPSKPDLIRPKNTYLIVIGFLQAFIEP